LDAQVIFNKLMDAILQETAADAVSILMPSDDGSHLYVAAIQGEDRAHLMGERIPISGSIAGWVAQQKEALLLQGIVNDERFRPLFPHPEIHSAISIPMQLGNRLVGVININATKGTRRFTRNQIKTLTILANTAGAALESAGLYQHVKQAEQNYRSIFENAVEGIYQTNREGRFLKANPAIANLLGYDSPGQMISAISDVAQSVYVYPEQRSEFTRLMEQNGSVSGFEIEYRRRDGSTGYLSKAGRVVRGEDGSVLYYEGIAVDITERKRAEQERARLTAEIENQRQRLDQILCDIPGMIFESWGEPGSNEHKMDFVSHYVEVLLGYTVAEWLSIPQFWISILHPEDRARVVHEASHQFRQGGTASLEFRWITKDQRTVWVRANTINICDEQGNAVGVRGVVTDITDRKDLEEQLRHSQKMEAVGRFAGGVAHDFNNLLTVINGYSSLGLQQASADSMSHRQFAQIKRAGDRAASLIHQILAFSRKQVLQPTVIDLNVLISDLQKMLQRVIGEDIELCTALSPDLRMVKADSGQIEQVLMNLISNSRDALPRGGKVTLATANVNRADRAVVSLQMPSDAYVKLSVRDDGAGIEAETLPHIFEPFFTTKELGKGTGLGLSTVYGIVKQSGGEIRVESELGVGTTFNVYLPVAEEPVGSEKRQEWRARVHGGETVLLVEDEKDVRLLVRHVLEANGYCVLEAKDGASALEVCGRHGGGISMMITDVVMTGMSGRELANRLLVSRPGMKVLFISGYAYDPAGCNLDIDPGSFLQKPFLPEQFLFKIRELLNAKCTDDISAD
jgi:PAS domain S-box-containing protein